MDTPQAQHTKAVKVNAILTVPESMSSQEVSRILRLIVNINRPDMVVSAMNVAD